MAFAKTLVIPVGRKLTTQPKSEILNEVEKAFHLFNICAVQVDFEIIRDSFVPLRIVDRPNSSRLSLSLMLGSRSKVAVPLLPWCMHLATPLRRVTGQSKESIDFGEVIQIEDQMSLDSSVYIGTRLVSIKLVGIPPHSLPVPYLV